MTIPVKIYNVSQSQLSLARHYGGITFNGRFYHYDHTDDTLTRDDVWEKARKTKAGKKAEKEKWHAVADMWGNKKD